MVRFGSVAALAAVFAGCGPAVATPDSESGTSTTTGSAATSDSGVSRTEPSSTLPTVTSVGSVTSSGSTTLPAASSTARASDESSSTGGGRVECDNTCQLPSLEHVWTVWAEDVLGPPPKQGRTSFSSDAFADGEVWLQTYVDESEPSALVRIAPDGTATHLTPSSLGFPPGGRIETPFVGSTEALISYFVEALPETGIVQFDSDLQGGCGAQSSDLVWERAVEVAPGSWALFGTQVGQLPARPVYFGDPCQASAQALLPFEQEVFPLLGFEYIDDRFVVSGVAGGEAFVRSFDSDGVQLTAWSSGTSDIAVGAWAGATPDGRVLVADWSSDAVRGGERFTLAYVELDSATAATYTFEALWPPTLTPPRHIIDFDVAEVPWMVYGGADLRISPLPAEGAEPCCPTITDEWLPEELNQFWELYAVPDGLIAITTASPREGVPEDVIVSRFGFVR